MYMCCFTGTGHATLWILVRVAVWRLTGFRWGVRLESRWRTFLRVLSKTSPKSWVAVKDLSLSFHKRDTHIYICICTYVYTFICVDMYM